MSAPALFAPQRRDHHGFRQIEPQDHGDLVRCKLAFEPPDL